MSGAKTPKKYTRKVPKQNWMGDGRPLSQRYKDPEAFYQHAQKYMKKCEKEKRPLTLSGLCAYIRCGHSAIRRLCKKTEEEWQPWAAVARQLMRELMAFTEEESLTAKHNARSNPAGAIFNLKANYGFEEAGQRQHAPTVNINLSSLDERLMTRQPVQVSSESDDNLISEGE